MRRDRSTPTLLSHALVAFTIELDNAFEHRMPHRTASGPAAGGDGPWLVSLAMWANFMRFVPDEGVGLRELDGRARITNLKGLERWGYVVVEPDLVRPTRAGRAAQGVWRTLPGEIEERWRARFGADAIARLRAALDASVDRIDVEPVDYLPVVGDAMFAKVPHLGSLEPVAAGADASRLDLSALMSRVLLAFTLDVERSSQLSLPMSANVVRVLSERDEQVRDLPRRAGVSKEAVSTVVGFLERKGYLAVERDPAGSRTKVARLTRAGERAYASVQERLRVVEDDWSARFGGDLDDLRETLGDVVGDGTPASPLGEGLQPDPDGWRARARPSDTLAHYPMVLHRGGYPDGA